MVTPGAYYSGGSAVWPPLQRSQRAAWPCPAARLSIPALAEQDPPSSQSAPHDPLTVYLTGPVMCHPDPPPSSCRVLPGLSRLCLSLPSWRLFKASCKPWAQYRHETLVWCLLCPSSLQRGLSVGSSLSHFKSTRVPHSYSADDYYSTKQFTSKIKECL